MSFLDLYSEPATAPGQHPGEQPSLPVGPGAAFSAAWDENRLFGQSIAQGNAQTQAIDDYVAEIKQKTGTDLESGALGDLRRRAGPQAVWQYLNDQATKLKSQNPQLDIAPRPDDIDEQAAAVSRAARQRSADIATQEKAPGAGLAEFGGGLAGSIVDPINLVAAPLGGGEGGILAHALRFGAIAAGTQAANEAIAAPFRERVQPGYLASGEPIENVAMAGAQGMTIGAGAKVLGNLWTRFKTGAWPTSVRDAGNILESEANIQQSNVYPGVAGEAAHREALTGAIDQVIKGEPVDVVGTVSRDLDIAAGIEEPRAAAASAAEAAQAARAAGQGEPAPQLPFEATAAEARAQEAAVPLRDAIAQVADRGGHMLAPDEIAALADRFAKMTPDDAANAVRDLQVAPHQLAEAPARVPRETPEVPLAAPQRPEATLGTPDHDAALRADIDRARMTGDVRIPAGVDADGEPVFRSLDRAMDEVDGYKEAADQIQACAAPQPAEMEPA